MTAHRRLNVRALLAQLSAAEAALAAILDCADPKCGALCAACVRAAQVGQATPTRPMPHIPEDDPVRRWK